MKILRLFVIILAICAISLTMKRKKVDNHNKNIKLKRRAAALLKKELVIGRAEYVLEEHLHTSYLDERDPFQDQSTRNYGYFTNGCTNVPVISKLHQASLAY